MSHDCPYRAAMQRVLSIELEAHANTSRDFGRGFAFALRLVRDAYESEIADLRLPPGAPAERPAGAC